jgi:hypothetical protein
MVSVQISNFYGYSMNLVYKLGSLFMLTVCTENFELVALICIDLGCWLGLCKIY